MSAKAASKKGGKKKRARMREKMVAGLEDRLVQQAMKIGKQTPVPPLDKYAMATRELCGQADMWSAEMLRSALHPMIVYRLPAVERTGFNGYDTMPIAPWLPQAQVTSTSTQPQMYGDSAYQRLNYNRTLGSRYGAFNGHAISAFDVTEMAVRVDLWFDPYDNNAPIKWQFFDNTTGLQTGSGEAAYQANPLVVAPLFVEIAPVTVASGRSTEATGRRSNSSSSVRSVDSRDETPMQVNTMNLRVDTANYYWPGGAILEVEAINLTAFSQCSMRAYSDDDVYQRFMPTATNATVANVGLEYGIISPFETASCYVCHFSPKGWGNAYTKTVLGDTAAWYAQSKGLAIQSGWPFLQVLVSNANTEIGFTGVTFSVKLDCWAGVAPSRLQYCGSMPEETVSFSVPLWLRSFQAIARVGAAREAVAGSVVIAAGRQLTDKNPGSTVLERKVSAVVEKEGVGSMILGVVPELLSTAITSLPVIGPLARAILGPIASKLASKIIPSVFRSPGAQKTLLGGAPVSDMRRAAMSRKLLGGT